MEGVDDLIVHCHLIMKMDFEGKQFDSPYYGLEAAVESYPLALQEALKPAIADLVGLSKEDPSRLLPR